MRQRRLRSPQGALQRRQNAHIPLSRRTFSTTHAGWPTAVTPPLVQSRISAGTVIQCTQNRCFRRPEITADDHKIAAPIAPPVPYQTPTRGYLRSVDYRFHFYPSPAPSFDIKTMASERRVPGIHHPAVFHGRLLPKKPERLLPMFAKPEIRPVNENGRTPVLAKPDTPLPRFENPEESPP